jgi:hypothetical protein
VIRRQQLQTQQGPPTLSKSRLPRSRSTALKCVSVCLINQKCNQADQMGKGTLWDFVGGAWGKPPGWKG